MTGLCHRILTRLGGVALLAAAASATGQPAGTPAFALGSTTNESIRACVEAANRQPFDAAECETALSRFTPADPAGQLQQLRLHTVAAVGYARAGRTDQATQHSAAAGASTDWVCVANIGVSQLYLGDFQGAAASFANALASAEAPPPELYLNQSVALRALGDFSAAAASYRAYEERAQRSASMLPPRPHVR